MNECTSTHYYLFIYQIQFLLLFHRPLIEEQSMDPSKCKPRNYIFFLKTHKTGSSTLTEILYRYGDDRNITFVLPKDPMFRYPERFHLSASIPLYSEEGKILCCHTRYNKGPVNMLFPKSKSKYITILRHPISQFESFFGYYKLTRILGLKKDINPIRTFLRNPTAFTGRLLKKHRLMWHMGLDGLVRNPSMFDLGLDPKYFEIRDAVIRYIKFIEEEFDLVLINEYFDESLILLKNLLCWDFDDILYLKQNVRKQKASLSEEVRGNILSWSRADLLLYNHFNKTLWRKILEAGPKFYEDLEFFREKNKIVGEKCGQELKKEKLGVIRDQKISSNKYLQMCVQMARKLPHYPAGIHQETNRGEMEDCR